MARILAVYATLLFKIEYSLMKKNLVKVMMCGQSTLNVLNCFVVIFFQLYMIPEIRTGILGVDMGPVESEDEQLDSEEKSDKDVNICITNDNHC